MDAIKKKFSSIKIQTLMKNENRKDWIYIYIYIFKINYGKNACLFYKQN